jgi:hypothetical protein
MPPDAGKRSAGGFDRVRGCEIGKRDIQLQHVIFPLHPPPPPSPLTPPVTSNAAQFREVFTSSNWLVRVYQLLSSAVEADDAAADVQPAQ